MSTTRQTQFHSQALQRIDHKYINVQRWNFAKPTCTDELPKKNEKINVAPASEQFIIIKMLTF